MFSITRFEPALQPVWDRFVDQSRNGTFLFRRDYMDYHRDRFRDHSLVIEDRGTIVALLPANEADGVLFSHQGLTYGGFIVSPRMVAESMLEAFSAVLNYLAGRNFLRFDYKTIPHIYHERPAEEDRYALFRVGATLVGRDILSVIAGRRRGPVQQRRRRALAKARQRNLAVSETEDWAEFWPVLTQRLRERYATTPVHSLAEIQRLNQRFPENIRLFTCRSASVLCGGAVVYETPRVAHVQYVAASDDGLETGALDALFEHLIESIYAQKPYFDFGRSTEGDSRQLNVGLVAFTEGFGATTVVHDSYSIAIR